MKNQKDNSLFTDKVILILYGVILFFSFFIVYNKIFDKKIDLNGDNASYYILGKSIATGNGFKSIYDVSNNPHTHFPPGYPAVMAVTQKIFSNKFVTHKRVNGLLFFMSIILIFIIILKLIENVHLSFVTSLMLIGNAILMRYSTIMMSEMTFLFFSSLSLYLMITTDFSKSVIKNWKFLLLIVFVTITYYVRSIGLALLVGIIAQLIYKKNWKYLLNMIGGFLLLRAPWIIRSQSTGGGSYKNQLLSKNPYRPELGAADVMDIIERIFENIQRYLTREIPNGVFNVAGLTPQNPTTTNEWIIGILLVIPIIYGLFKIKNHTSIFLFYLLGYFGILLLWPQVWYGPRFMLPIIPIITFLFFNGAYSFMNFAASKLLKIKPSVAMSIVFVVLSIVFIKVNATTPIKKIITQAKGKHPRSYTNYFELGTWLKINAPQNSITAARKVKLLYLYSGQHAMKYKYTLNEEEQIEYLKSKNTDYVILEQLGFSSTSRYLYPAIKKYPEKFKLIKHLKKPDTYLLKFIP